MANENKPKLGIGGIAILAGMAIFALFVAFIVVPTIARTAGLHEQHVNYAVAGAAFVIAIVATRWAKYLNKKSAERK
jgi:hypothetical protein